MENAPLEQVDQPSTHATRNPSKKIIPPRANYRKQSAAERATSNVRRALKREKKAALKQDIAAFVEERDRRAAELAVKYSQKSKKMCEMLSGALLIKEKRRVNTWNALVSRRGKELNEGCAEGDRYTLGDIQETVRREIDEGKYLKVDDDELRQELEEMRELKTKGARSSNRAAAVDYNAACRRIHDELGNLHERCGTMAFAFMTRGHVNDTIAPGWIESEGSIAFVREVLDITPAELMRKFELWACAKDRTKTFDSLASLRTECMNLIIGGLQKILKLSNVVMHYEKYETDVVERYGVLLRGWPEGLQFRSPAKITNFQDARMLREALLAGECMWIKLTRQEKDDRTKARQAKIASGAIQVKKRKKRSDAGKPRGPKKTGQKRKRGQAEDNEAEGEDFSEGAEASEDEGARPKKKHAHI
ncbi:hypothetical protein LshimejAT787_0505660 [Lyophyllum shimeji]|uniref:Uncharacterized protein n=1 Tax=Lyophyllum shimeji TaxID=47721 RepID=A0A9P3PNU5_LYOSH|nr:hypothetical protein LshimejAT787_0505660 [Lyophyllum shimeji]